MIILYYVYRHTTPNGKVYIGITGMEHPECRWRSNGAGYKNNHHFWSAIQKYGWDNIQHDILMSDLTLHDAQLEERRLISEYKSNDPMYGYNNTTGGDYHTQKFNQVVIDKLRDNAKKMWSTPEIRKKLVAGLTGHTVSAATKLKISNSKRGVKLSHPSKLHGKSLSESHRFKLIGKTPWNKGLTKDVDSRIAEYSANLTGIKRSDESRHRISIAQKLKYKLGYKPIWMNNGVVERLIETKDVQKYLISGFCYGRLNAKNLYINKDGVTKKIREDELDLYLSNWWKKGKDFQTTRTISESHRKYVYTYGDFQCYSCKELMIYLQHNGYPSISLSSVINIASGKSVKRYESLTSSIQRTPIS